VTGPEVSPVRWTVSVKTVTSSCTTGAVCVNWSSDAGPVAASLSLSTKASPASPKLLPAYVLWMGVAVGKSAESVPPAT
jgi:hypothetical protein